jgi:hypothetical protein
LLLLECAQQAADVTEQPEQDEAEAVGSRPLLPIGTGSELLILIEADGRLAVLK